MAKKQQPKNDRRNVGPIRVKSVADFAEFATLSERCNEMVENRCEIFIHNVQYLCRKNNIAQHHLCEVELDGMLNPAQLSVYGRKGREIPFRVMALVASAFNLTVEKMCGELLDEATPEGERRPALSQRSVEECNKYPGVYEMAYFDTGKPLGQNDSTTSDSLAKGLLTIYPGNAVNGVPTLRVAALVNCTDSEMEALKKALKTEQDKPGVSDFRSCYLRVASAQKTDDGEMPRMKCFYEGTVELTERMAEITMRQSRGNDIVHLLMHNRAATSSGGKTYRGGLATMMSVSRGSEHMPCIQSVILSKKGFDLKAKEELANWLYLCPPEINVKESVKAIVSYMKFLFSTSEIDTSYAGFSEADKTYCLESFAEKKLTDALRHNLLSYYKVSTAMDSDIYRALCR